MGYMGWAKHVETSPFTQAGQPTDLKVWPSSKGKKKEKKKDYNLYTSKILNHKCTTMLN